MKIAVIIHRLTFKGGTQRQALELARELKKLGHKVKLYVFEYDPVNTYTELLQGLDVVSLPTEYAPKKVEPFWVFFTRPSFLAWWFKRNRWSRRLAYLIDKDTDILNPHAFYVYAVSYYFKKEIKDVPAVWMLNTMTLRSWKFWRAGELNLDFRVPLPKRIFYRIMDWIELDTFIRPHRIVVLNSDNQRYVKEWMGKEAEVVRTGADLEKFKYKKREPLRAKPVRLLGVGALFEHRRYEDAIEAVKLLVQKGYDVYFGIVGDVNRKPEYYAKLSGLISNLNLQKQVKFLGVVSEEELLRLYYESDVGVFPSTLHPGNLATFEMMACGTPVIVSRGASTSELLTHEENAILVNPKEPQGIASAFEVLLNNPKLYLKLSKNGRSFIEKNLTWSQYAKSMLKIFELQFKSDET